MWDYEGFTHLCLVVHSLQMNWLMCALLCTQLISGSSSAVGAFGYVEATRNTTRWTKAIGDREGRRRTPVVVRFSTKRWERANAHCKCKGGWGKEEGEEERGGEDEEEGGGGGGGEGGLSMH